MKKTLLMIVIPATAILFSGCSNILMPYKSDFKCQKGAGLGVCNSISENYEILQTNDKSTYKEEEQNIHQEEKALLKTKQETLVQNSLSECIKCIDVSQAIWMQQRKLEKDLKKEQ